MDQQVNLVRFKFEPVTQSIMEKQILNLNSKKSAGYDSIPPKVLKESVNIVKNPLRLLFNISLEKEQFPSELKYADVSPLFKKDAANDKQNYRPISILPSISKVFERFLFQQITNLYSKKILHIFVVLEKVLVPNMPFFV